MIPLARDSVTLYIYRRGLDETDEGDVIETWTRSKRSVRATIYPESSKREFMEEGAILTPLYRIIMALPRGMTIESGDRLGDLDGMEWKLYEVEVARGRASCTGLRL